MSVPGLKNNQIFVLVVLVYLTFSNCKNWAPLSHAGQTQDKAISTESETKYDSSSKAANGVMDYFPKEIWRLDGSSETSVFGLIYDAVASQSGSIYMLDIQLKEVLEIDVLGNIVNRFGGPGEGPGEFVRPLYLFIDDKSHVGVMQNVPRKIEMFSGSGEILGNYPLPEYGESLRPVLRGAEWRNNCLYMVLLSRDINERGDSIDNNALVSTKNETKEMVVYDELSIFRSINNAHFKEKEMSRVSPWKWTVGPLGEVYSNRDFDIYKISVRDNEGNFVREISRQYSSRQRLDWNVKKWQEAKDRKFEGRLIGGVPITYEVSPTDPDIEKLFARDDGTLWVLSSRGAYETPKGVLGVFDVFDPEGRFDHQAAVHGDGNFMYDYYFISHGYLIVVHNALRSEGDYDWINGVEEYKYEIICYKL